MNAHADKEGVWLNRTHVGDCRALLRAMAADGVKVQTCVTSPPYFGLRDYGHDEQIGLELTPAEYVAAMVEVFRCVRDVLVDDGTVWLNLGDSYAGSGRGGNPGGDTSTLQGSRNNQEASIVKRDRDDIGASQRESAVTQRGSRLPAGLHESARQAGAVGRAWVPPPAGLKQKDLIGAPWRVAFALQLDGWYLRSDIIWHKPNPMPESVTDRPTKSHEYLFLLAKSERYYYDADAIKEAARDTGRVNGIDGRDENAAARPPGSQPRTLKRVDYTTLGRNKRSVWTVPVASFSGAHFATFPRELIEPCILAGSPAAGIVLDPFMGSGTTGQVATDLGRQFIGCELNPAYVELHEQRRTTIGMPL